MSVTEPDDRRALVVLKLAALAASVAVLAPFWPALVLAVWTGTSVQRWTQPFRRLAGGRNRAAAALTVLTVALILLPLLALAAVVASDAVALVERTLTSREAQAFVRGLVVSPEGQAPLSISELVTEHGSRAWALLREVSTVAVHWVVGAMVFIITTYAVLADGPALYAWFLRHSPLSPRIVARLGHAFLETGRGLFVGVLGAGLVQGVTAGILFMILGVPRPIVLGFLTVIASIVPNLGSALVWGPVAAGLAFTGRSTAAIALVVLGVGLIGTIDNVFRPLLSRRGSLQLPAFMVLLSMLGGIFLIGTWGFLAGPLILRLAKEVLVMSDDAEPPASAEGAEAPASPPAAPAAPSSDG